MVIISTFTGDQKSFHHYWCPLMYKHQECQFRISGQFVYPKDIKNLQVNTTDVASGPTLKCPIDKLPTYRAMIELQKKDKSWVGDWTEIGEDWFYNIA